MPADNTTGKEIADLQKRLADLDRERDEVLARLEQSEAEAAAKLKSTIAQGTCDIARQVCVRALPGWGRSTCGETYSSAQSNFSALEFMGLVDFVATQASSRLA
jgi:hypothetical protein